MMGLTIMLLLLFFSIGLPVVESFQINYGVMTQHYTNTPSLFQKRIKNDGNKFERWFSSSTEQQRRRRRKSLRLYQSNQDEEESEKKKKKRKLSILVCPAQFCVPADYDDFLRNLKIVLDSSEDNNFDLGTLITAPLSRTKWIQVARQLPTSNFWEGTLSCRTTLSWYFDAIEEGLSDILSQSGPDTNVCLVGHSIGGWVARAYLSGLSRSSTAVTDWARGGAVSSLVTLGTPHKCPSTALVDQTRGLLQQIENEPSSSSQALVDAGIRVSNVASNGIKGSIFTTNIEQAVAAASYYPLLGRLNNDNNKPVCGDGIVPIDIACMDEPAQCITLSTCPVTDKPVCHAHVIPTPWKLWNGGTSPSWRVSFNDNDNDDAIVWYGSPSVLKQWAPQCIS